MKKIGMYLMIFIIFFNIAGNNVYATEVQVRTKVEIQIMSIPDDFIDIVTVIFENSQTGEKTHTKLTKDNGYKSILSLLGGVEYNISTNFYNQESYSVLGIKDKYFIKGTNFSLRFNIVKNNIKTETTTNEIENITLDNKEKIKQGTKAFSNATEKIIMYCESQNENETIKTILNTYYESNIDNLVNQINNNSVAVNKRNITQVDTWIYYILYKEINKNSNYLEKNKNSFLDNVEIFKTILYFNTENNGTKDIIDNTYQAIYDVWEWVYDYYAETGELYDFYKNDNIPYVKELKERLGVEVNTSEGETTNKEETSNNTEEQTTLREEETTLGEELTVNTSTNDKEMSSWDKVVDGLKSNMISIIILVVMGVIILVLYLKGKKSKANEIDID